MEKKSKLSALIMEGRQLHPNLSHSVRAYLDFDENRTLVGCCALGFAKIACAHQEGIDYTDKSAEHFVMMRKVGKSIEFDTQSVKAFTGRDKGLGTNREDLASDLFQEVIRLNDDVLKPLDEIVAKLKTHGL